jgi:hypothetical protein
MKPISSRTLSFSAAAASTSAMVTASGFSQKMCLPEAAAV